MGFKVPGKDSLGCRAGFRGFYLEGQGSGGRSK